MSQIREENQDQNRIDSLIEIVDTAMASLPISIALDVAARWIKEASIAKAVLIIADSPEAFQNLLGFPISPPSDDPFENPVGEFEMARSQADESALAPEDEGVRFVPVEEFDGGEFYRFRVTIQRFLHTDEVFKVAQAIGYAFAEVFRGEGLGLPEVEYDFASYGGRTRLTFDYDLTKSRSDDPDLTAAFGKAEAYIRRGSPVRKTNRAGIGTKGTSLVQGIGDAKILFEIEQ